MGTGTGRAAIILLAGIPTRGYAVDMNTDIVEAIRRQAKRGGVTGYRLSKDSGVTISVVQRIIDGGGAECRTAEKLARALGYRIVLQAIKGK